MTISIRDQQALLKDAGFDPGPIDGFWGKNTQTAYNNWRRAKRGIEDIDAAEIPGGSKLEGVHPDLVKVVQRAAANTDLPFRILEGTRTLARQRQLKARGASKTLNSRHIPADNGYGHAVDIAPLEDGKVSWNWQLYYPLADAIKQAANEVGVPIEWGGDWRSFKDGPHWQLPWKSYPGK